MIANVQNQGRRLLIFVTTSELSILKMLGVMKLFRRQIPVPAISDLRELQGVLTEEGSFDAGDIQGILNTVAQEAGSQGVGIGIRTVLECLEESRVEAARGEANMAESFTSRVVGAIQSNAIVEE